MKLASARRASMIYRLGLTVLCLFCIVACGPVKVAKLKQYSIDSISTKRLAKKASSKTILVSLTKSVSGYSSQDMIYIKQPYQLDAFARNEWVAPPAEMLDSVITESLQNTGYFRAVVTPPYSALTNFKLNATVIELKQSFLKRPSQIQMTLKIDLVDYNRNAVIATKRFHERLNAPMDNPYGGVLAANSATQKIMTRVSEFVVNVCRGVKA